MYEAFYNLSNDPFRLLPDPGICFPHRSCAKAWAYLRYALKRGEGIVVVTGPPGTGKTTLAERLLNELNPAKTVSVRLIANDLNATDLLRKLAYSFELPVEGMDRAMLAHRIERFLVELEHSQRRALVLIDEAQTLSHHALEAMRLLTDLQSRSRPVLQLFLLGQEELEGVMCAPGMTQFQQRVIASSRLHTMSLTETKAYLEYRLSFADWAGDPSINGPAVMAIYRYSQGLPRHINKICSRLLLHGCTEEKRALGEQDVLAVVQDLRDELLAPMNGEQEASATLEGSAFETVYELALVPAARPAETENQSPRDVRSAAASPVDPQAVAGNPHQTQTYASPDDWQKDAPGGYVYGAGYPRPHQLRRLIQRNLRAPGVLARRWWGIAVRNAPRIQVAFTRVRREASVAAGKGIRTMRGWVANPGIAVQAQKVRAGWASLPRAVAAGLGVLLVGVLGLVVWNLGGDPEPSTVDREVVDAATMAVPAALLVPDAKSRYLEIVAKAADDDERQKRGGLPVSPGLNVDGLLPERGARVSAAGRDDGPLGEPGGTTGDLSQSVRGKATDDVVADPPFSPTAPAGVDDAQTSEAVAVELAVEGRGDAEAPARDAGSSPSRQMPEIESGGYSLAKGPAPLVPMKEPGGISADVAAEDNPVEDAGRIEGPEALSAIEPLPEGNDRAAQSVPAALQATALSPDSGDSGGEAALADSARQVLELLASADTAMESDQLMYPSEGSAYDYFQQVLALDAQNEDAHAGLDRIVRRYRDLASWALKGQALEKAEKYVGRALRVEPDNAEMLALRDRINDAIAEVQAAELAEAERARLALEMSKAAPIVEPEEKQENSYNNFMRFVDGLQADSEN